MALAAIEANPSVFMWTGSTPPQGLEGGSGSYHPRSFSPLATRQFLTFFAMKAHNLLSNLGQSSDHVL